MKRYKLGSRIQSVFAWKKSQQPDPQPKPAPPTAWSQEDQFDMLCWSQK